MADFVLNFASEPSDAGPSSSAVGRVGGSKKSGGGRWTDRANDKRRSKLALKKQHQQQHQQKDHQQDGKGKQRVDDERAEGSKRVKLASSAGAEPGQEMDLDGPERRLPASGAAPGQRKQGQGGYISSLFTAAGFPTLRDAPSPATADVHTGPSNAPLPSSNSNSKEEQEKGPLEKLGLVAGLARALKTKMGIEAPTSTQALAVPALLLQSASQQQQQSQLQEQEKDFILRAQTGSGKTLAFLLPLVQDLLLLPRSVYPSTTPREVGTLALILAPTRELAAQIHSVLEALLGGLESSPEFSVSPRHLTPCLLVGGANRNHEKRRLRKGCPIIIATPGRMLDHLKQTLALRFAGEGQAAPPHMVGLRWFIADECDRLMDLGFEEQMKAILEEVDRRNPGKKRQGRRTVLASATASEGVDRLCRMALRAEKPVVLREKRVEVDMGVDGEPKEVAVDELPVEQVEESKKGKEKDNKEEDPFLPPSQLIHSYIVVPPKLRYVTLLSLLRRILSSSSSKDPRRKAKGGRKVVVFLSCTDAVDFYWRAVGGMGMGQSEGGAALEQEAEKEAEAQEDDEGGDDDEQDASDDDAEDEEDDDGQKKELKSAKELKDISKKAERKASKQTAKSARQSLKAAEQAVPLASFNPLLPGVPFYKLHGSLPLASRLASLAAFSKVSKKKKDGEQQEEEENAVLFCTSVAARGLDIKGVSEVVQFDLPTEGGIKEYIHRVGRTARAGASGSAYAFLLESEVGWVDWARSSGINLREEGVEDVLSKGFGGKEREWEGRATDVQMSLERWVLRDESNAELARSAFRSHIRAYATHPAAEKDFFNKRALHLGHLAKSFGMREAPRAMLQRAAEKDKKRKPPPSAAAVPETPGLTPKRLAIKPAVALSRPAPTVAAALPAAKKAKTGLSEREKAERVLATLGSAAGGADDLLFPPSGKPSKSKPFEVGFKVNESRARKRAALNVMKGPKGGDAGEFQIAGGGGGATTEELEMLVYGAKGAPGKKRKRD